MTISVVGLGKLGAPLAACLAAAHYQVVACDRDELRVQGLRQGTLELNEQGVQQLLESHASRIRWTTERRTAIQESSLTFLILPTPSHPDGHFELDLVLAACHEVGLALRDKSDWHLVVLVSTVMPGDCDTSIIPALEAASGKKCGEAFSFCYNPAFIALGSVVHNLRYPDMILIGESDSRGGESLEQILGHFRLNSAPILRTSPINAEIAKLSLNTYITMKISFANQLAQLCMRTPGASARAVTQIVGQDSRIGKKYLQGGLSYGGPCFPRDTKAFESFAGARGLTAGLARATERINREHQEFILEWVQQHSQGQQKAAILGLAYKPHTPVVEESPGLALCAALLAKGWQVHVFDPLAECSIQDPLLQRPGSAEECVESASLVVLTTACPEFAQLQPDLFSQKSVLDCWALLDPCKLPSTCVYRALGDFTCP